MPATAKAGLFFGLRRLGVAQQGDDEHHARGADALARCI
jgi:hypothetical protein